MIYIQQIGIINYKEEQHIDIKTECKRVAPQFIRRTDDFIQLAILGVEQVKRLTPIAENTSLYLTSGQGNLGVFQRLCDQRFIEKSPPKPVDFINSLSNTAGFYVSQFLNLDSKHTNLSHLSFVVEMALLLAKSELSLKKEDAILLGGVDQLLSASSFQRNALGIPEMMPLGQGSNWMLLSNSPEKSLARLDVNNVEMDKQALHDYLFEKQGTYHLAFSLLMESGEIKFILEKTKQPRFFYEQDSGFYETVVLYAINKFIQNEQGKLLFVDYFEGKYRVIEIETC